jgi:hypothetical protein
VTRILTALFCPTGFFRAVLPRSRNWPFSVSPLGWGGAFFYRDTQEVGFPPDQRRKGRLYHSSRPEGGGEMEGETDRWCVARIHNHASTGYAAKNLKDQHFETFMPTVRHRVFSRGRVHEVDKPLFGGYLFIALDLSDWYWRKVNSTRGVIHLLPMHAEEPVPPAGGIYRAAAADEIC